MDPVTMSMLGSVLGKGLDWLSNKWAGDSQEKMLDKLLNSDLGKRMFIEKPDLSPVYMSEKQKLGQTMSNKKSTEMGQIEGMGYNPIQLALVGEQYDNDLLGGFTTLSDSYMKEQSAADYQANAYNASVAQQLIDQMMKIKGIKSSTGINLGTGLLNNFSKMMGAIPPTPE